MAARHYVRVLEAIFAHPFPHNVEWEDVLSLIRHLGSVTERHDGKYEFEIDGVRAVFEKPRHKEVEPDGIVELRRFLNDAGIRESAAPEEPPQVTVVTIDHHIARFFERHGKEGGFVEVDSVEPKDPHGFRRHLEHRKEAHYKGERTPESDDLFYEPIAQRLKHSAAIILVGEGTGKSSALGYLTRFLGEKHKDVAARIVDEQRTDLSHLTLGDIERIAATANSTGVRTSPFA